MNEGTKMPSWPALLKAIALAALMATVLDLAIHFWRTPLGWSVKMTAWLIGIGALFAFLLSAAVGLVAGLPVGRLLARRQRFQPAILIPIGIAMGFATTVLLSALGNTNQFMTGIAFWQGFAVAGATGGIAAYLWHQIEMRRPMESASTTHG